MTTRMVSFRVDREQCERFDEAAQQAGMTRSIWAREILDAAAREALGLSADGTKPHPSRAIRLGATVAAVENTATCQHPSPALRRLTFRTVCQACGATVKQGDGD